MIERILAGDQPAGGRAAATGAAPAAGERHDSDDSLESMVSAHEGDNLLDGDEGGADALPAEEYDEDDVLGLNATMQANERRRRRRAVTPSSTSGRVAKRAADAAGSHLYAIVLLIYTTLAAAEDVGDTGKVWLISDIFDTLWHRCEMRINQVRHRCRCRRHRRRHV